MEFESHGMLKIYLTGLLEEKKVAGRADGDRVARANGALLAMVFYPPASSFGDLQTHEAFWSVGDWHRVLDGDLLRRIYPATVGQVEAVPDFHP
jgi:hypothetical protein